MNDTIAVSQSGSFHRLQ